MKPGKLRHEVRVNKILKKHKNIKSNKFIGVVRTWGSHFISISVVS